MILTARYTKLHTNVQGLGWFAEGDLMSFTANFAVVFPIRGSSIRSIPSISSEMIEGCGVLKVGWMFERRR
jgi:hypothetical protein